MDDISRTMLRPGDRVTVRMDDGEEKPFWVKYAPWQLGNGSWVIGLRGIAGGYDLRRVVERVEAGANVG